MPSPRSAWIVTLGVAAAVALSVDRVAAQPTVRASAAWVQASSSGETTAFATVENGTMYDVYLVAATSDVGTIEVVQMKDGKPGIVKEVPVASFDRLEMSANGTFLKLTQLKRPLKAGDTVTINLDTDRGERLTMEAIVK